MTRSEDVRSAQAQWQHFMLEAPEYPRGFFSGKGIAILGGGPQYMVPAWVNVHMLRAAGGCASAGMGAFNMRRQQLVIRHPVHRTAKPGTGSS